MTLLTRALVLSLISKVVRVSMTHLKLLLDTPTKHVAVEELVGPRVGPYGTMRVSTAKRGFFI